jgi:hypothetical protein
MEEAVMPPDCEAWRSRLWMGRTVVARVGEGFHDGQIGRGLKCRLKAMPVQFAEKPTKKASWRKVQTLRLTSTLEHKCPERRAGISVW